MKCMLDILKMDVTMLRFVINTKKKVLLSYDIFNVEIVLYD